MIEDSTRDLIKETKQVDILWTFVRVEYIVNKKILSGQAYTFKGGFQLRFESNFLFALVLLYYTL